jgi:hypothetical protein
MGVLTINQETHRSGHFLVKVTDILWVYYSDSYENVCLSVFLLRYTKGNRQFPDYALVLGKLGELLKCIFQIFARCMATGRLGHVV